MLVSLTRFAHTLHQLGGKNLSLPCFILARVISIADTVNRNFELRKHILQLVKLIVFLLMYE